LAIFGLELTSWKIKDGNLFNYCVSNGKNQVIMKGMHINILKSILKVESLKSHKSRYIILFREIYVSPKEQEKEPTL